MDKKVESIEMDLALRRSVVLQEIEDGTSFLVEGHQLPVDYDSLWNSAERGCYGRELLIGVTTPNVKIGTLSNFDHSFEAAKGRSGLKEPLRRRPEACQV